MRTKMSLTAAFAATLLAASPAYAQEEEKSEQTERAEKAETEKAEPKAEKEAPKVTCKRISLDMSTRRKQKVCLTEEGWEEYKKQKRGGN